MHRYVLQPIERHAQLLEEKLAILPALKTVARYDEAEDAVMDDPLLSGSHRASLLRQLRLKKIRANLAFKEAGPRAIHVKPHKSVRFTLPPGIERKRQAEVVIGIDGGPPGKRVKKQPYRIAFKKPKVGYKPKKCCLRRAAVAGLTVKTAGWVITLVPAAAAVRVAWAVLIWLVVVAEATRVVWAV